MRPPCDFLRLNDCWAANKVNGTTAFWITFQKPPDLVRDLFLRLRVFTLFVLRDIIYYTEEIILFCEYIRWLNKINNRIAKFITNNSTSIIIMKYINGLISCSIKSITGLDNKRISFLTSSCFNISKHCWEKDKPFILQINHIFIYGLFVGKLSKIKIYSNYIL